MDKACSGMAERRSCALPKVQKPLDTIKTGLSKIYSKEQIYQFALEKLQLALGPHLRWIENVQMGEGEFLGKLRLP